MCVPRELLVEKRFVLNGDGRSATVPGGLCLKNFEVSYGGSGFRLGPIDLALPTTGVVGLLGRNGAGKSSLMRGIANLAPLAAGSVAIDGEVAVTRAQRRQARRLIGYVPQSATLPALPSTEAFMHYAAYLRGVDRSSRTETVERALTSLNLLPQRDVRLGRLSGGMARRVLIAQALVTQPRILLLDEPTAGLDPEQRSSLKRLVTDLSNDVLVLLATHLVEDIAELASQVVVLDKGSMVFNGGVEDFSDLAGARSDEQPARLEAAFAAALGSTGSES